MNTIQNAYITSIGSFLPGKAIPNDQMEQVLGLVDGQPSRLRKRILKSNGIKSRHYAINNGKPSHLNEEMAALAVKSALKARNMSLENIDMLAAGTTMPDILVPGFASMIHGRLGGTATDILSTAGVCCAGMTAMKAVVNSIKCGEHTTAISVASENPSVMLQGSRFEKESRSETDSEYEFFNADFLRWMLSDGAGAVVVENKPNPQGISLKVEWISMRSYAHNLPTCMYLGTCSPHDLKAGNTWLGESNIAMAERKGNLLYQQDIKLLKEHTIEKGAEEAARLQSEGFFSANDIDHFLPHISSYFFEEKSYQCLADLGVAIPKERWFTNLATMGNTGAASIYIILEEAIRSGRIKPNDRILMMVPESGRFSYSYALLTCINNCFS